MYSFLLVAIPSTTVFFLLYEKRYRPVEFTLPIGLGVLVSVLVCTITEFFIFNSEAITDSPKQLFVDLLLKQICIPSLFLCGFFFLISRRCWDYKTTAVFPLLCSFYAVFLPYSVITGSEPKAGFLLFIKPILLLSNIAILYAMSRLATANKTFRIPFIILALLSLTVLPFAQTCWYFNIMTVLWAVTTALYAIAAAGLILFAQNMIKKTEVSATI